VASLKFNVGVGLLWIVLAVVMRAMTESSWALCWVLGGAFSYIWILQHKLDHLASEHKALSGLFEIADAELVRVSALANELESDVSDLDRKVEQIAWQVDNG
jgi:hypothetical protein